MTGKRSLLLPSIHGQQWLFEKHFKSEIALADEVFQFGNLVGLQDYARDKKASLPNNKVLSQVKNEMLVKDWHQLIGPNELAALQNPDTWTNKNSDVILRYFWGNVIMKTATVSKGRLLTHGGLTYGEWLDLGAPKTAEVTAELLNEKYAKTLYQGPCFALGNGPNFWANPIWASLVHEVIPSWIGAPESLPFDQMTGGVSLNEPVNRSLIANNKIYSYLAKVRYPQWGSWVEIKGQRIISLDLAISEERLTSIPNERQLYVECEEA